MNKSKSTDEVHSLCRQYSKLVRSHKKAETNIKKLKENKDTISKENFDKYLTENEQTLNDTKPKLLEIETYLKDKFEIQLDKKNKIEAKIEELEKSIKEYDRLYSIGVISKEKHKENLVAISDPLKDKIAEYKQIKKITATLTKALDNPENIDDPEIEDSSGGKPEPHAEDNKYYFREGIQKLLKKNDILAHILSQTNNYLQRFLAFIVLSQLLYLFLFVILRLEYYIRVGLSGLGLTFLMFFVIAICFVIVFLFTGARAKTGTYIGTALTYFVVSLCIASIMGSFSLFEIWSISFLGTWGFWNLTLSVIILGIGLVRIFILGIGADYRQKAF